MSRKKKELIEFRYYDTPQDEPVLALLGRKWDRTYGHDADGMHIHFHNLMEIGLCLRGDGEMIFHDRALHYAGGMFTLIPVNYPHTTYSYGEETNAWEYLFFDPVKITGRVAPDDPARQRELLYWLGRGAWLMQEDEDPQMYGLIRLILEEMRAQKAQYRAAVQRLTEALILLITRHHQEKTDRTGSAYAGREGREDSVRDAYRIFPVFDYVNEHYAEPLKVGDLARVCSMSETHMRRLFDAIMHMSPTDYVNLVRVQKACELLKRTDESLELVASQCGYGNVSTLNRNFRKLLGVTPYQWKKRPDNYERGLLQFRVTAIRGW